MFYRGANDPRKAPERQWGPEMALESNAQADFGTLIAMMAGMGGLLLRWKALSWLGFFSMLMSLTQMRTSELSPGTAAGHIMISTMSLFMNYFGPYPSEPLPPDA